MRMAAIFLLFLFILPVAAEEAETADAIEADAYTLYRIDEFDTESVLEALPDELLMRLPDDIFNADEFETNFSAEYFFRLFGDALRQTLSPMLRMTATTLGIVLLASGLSALRGLMKSHALASLFEFVSGLCMMLAVYRSMSELFSTVHLYLTQLSGMVNAMLPLMIAIGTASGNLSSTSVAASGMMLALALIETLATSGLFPVLQLCLGLTIATGLGGGFRLDGISKMVRGIFTGILGAIAATVSAVMSFQTSIAAHADSVSMRAIKFAASKAIPVAGGIASDAVGAIAGSLSLVRATVGAVGVILIIVLTLPVIVHVLLVRLGVSVSHMVAEMLGLERERRLLAELVGLLGFLAAVCVIAALMFVYALTLFAKMSAALGS